MKQGPYEPITPKEVRALRQRHGLSQAQFAVLARSSVSLNKEGGQLARRVQAWESGESRMSCAQWELVTAKLKMITLGLTTYEELASKPLVKILFPSNIDFTKSTQ